MTILNADATHIQAAAQQIKSGGVIAFPTETVYGLGANALNSSAVAQIFEIKNRPYFDPLIVHIANFKDLEQLAEVNELALKLTRAFWPGPLTLVLKKMKNVPDLVTSGLSTVAVRMPNHPVALELIRLSGMPLAAPSANPFGYLSPTTAQHVETQLGNRIPMILDGGPCATGVESTILDLSSEKPAVLRWGGTPAEEIEKIIGSLQMRSAGKVPAAPGQLEQHYAPRKVIKILRRDEIIKQTDLKSAGVMLFRPGDFPRELKPKKVEILSASGDLRDAAANLFSALHRLDESSAYIIFAEPVPEVGLGKAIMDRLRRAAATHV